MALMVQRARYKSVRVAGVVSKQGRCLCRRVSVLSEAGAYVEGVIEEWCVIDEGLVPLWSLRAGSLTDDDRSQVVDGNVKGKPLLTVARCCGLRPRHPTS